MSVQGKDHTPIVFMEVVSWGQRGFVTDWYEKELELEAQEEFDGTLTILAATPRADWDRPPFSPLANGICEIRFFANGKQYRPLGWDGPEKNQFTILVGAYKKARTWKPPDARKIAEKRRTEVLNGIRKVRPYDQYKF